MRHLEFEMELPVKLREQFALPPSELGVELLENFGPLRATLWWGSEGIQIQCNMVDVAERLEFGVLNFSAAQVMAAGAKKIPWPSTEGRLFSVSKLVVSADDVLIEAGLEFQCQGIPPIQIVCGQMPHSLAILGLPDFQCTTKPDFPLERYSRVPFQP